jgi:hypothetical protein
VSDYDDGRGRGRHTVAIVIAVVFLVVLGASVGYILATNHQGKDDDGGTGQGPTTPTTTATGNGGGGSKSTRSATPSTRPSTSYPPANGANCPAQAREAAGGGPLTLVRFLLTARSEVWICRDNPGNLYYQGHVRGTSFDAPTSSTSIFLTGVREEGGNYRATNGDTQYVVSPDHLRILKNGVETNNEPSVGG